MPNINILNPLTDARWSSFAASHPNASVFHQVGWIRALVQTYGYEPIAITTAGPLDQLTNGIVLCRLSSWLTGNRLVSLPFSDHCEPLFDGADSAEALLNALSNACARERYCELRPLSSLCAKNAGLQVAGKYWFHELDLSPNLSQIFSAMHINSYQRKIRRAENEGISYESGRSPNILSGFYRLVVKTRKRQGLLPQPLRWFKNLVSFVGQNLQIRLASKSGTPIAAMLTLRHGSRVVFKYGCSDAAQHQLGGMPFLFWKLIEESKESVAESIDLGRSDLDNAGLIRFKDRLGATRKPITYFRYFTGNSSGVASSWKFSKLGTVVSTLPETFLSAAGGCFYKHFG